MHNHSCLILEKSGMEFFFKFNVLPPLNDKRHILLILRYFLVTVENKLRTKVLLEYLIQWKDFPLGDTTWERPKILQHPTLNLFSSEDVVIHLNGTSPFEC